MTDIEQSLRAQNDVLRARIRECLEANARANLIIASIADEQAALTRASLRVTTAETLRYLMKNPVDGYPVPTSKSAAPGGLPS